MSCHVLLKPSCFFFFLSEGLIYNFAILQEHHAELKPYFCKWANTSGSLFSSYLKKYYFLTLHLAFLWCRLRNVISFCLFQLQLVYWPQVLISLYKGCKQSLRESLSSIESTVKTDLIKREWYKKRLQLPVSWGTQKLAPNKSKWVAGPGSELL